MNIRFFGFLCILIVNDIWLPHFPICLSHTLISSYASQICCCSSLFRTLNLFVRLSLYTEVMLAPSLHLTFRGSTIFKCLPSRSPMRIYIYSHHSYFLCRLQQIQKLYLNPGLHRPLCLPWPITNIFPEYIGNGIFGFNSVPVKGPNI